MTSKQILHELEGQEIKSVSLASIVGVHNGRVIDGGVEIKVTPTQVKELWVEYLYQEGITDIDGNNIDPEISPYNKYGFST